MAYTASLRMLMDSLKKLINGNHHLLINNDPIILSEKPKFQLLYQELAFINQTLSYIHQHHHHNPDEIEKVRDLKNGFKFAVLLAQDIIDLYLSAVTVHFRKEELSPARSDVSLDLEDLMGVIESIKVELMTIHIDNMKMSSSPRTDPLETQSAVAATRPSSNRHPIAMKKPLLEDTCVGLDHHVEIIRDKFVEDTKQLSIVSIVGMGGLGKTTLATKLFNDPFIKRHFHVRAWATVSQTYVKRDLLIQILVSIGGVQEDLEKDNNDSKLREKLHKKLMGRRYLIVIDDIWSIEAWDELKMFFPHDNNASRILLTTRLNEVASHVESHGFVYSLPCLKEEESWELLKQKVFHGDECPEWLIQSGRKIARKCHGLPLSVVVMAGVLATTDKDLWENIACSVGSYMIGNQTGCMETLALSYHHLPHHLRECFLYLGGFPEDSVIDTKKVIWLWVAEGFVEEARNQSLEVAAEAYLMDLIHRNLVTVARRTFVGDVKACKLHDLVRELCLQKAKEERFFHKIGVHPLPSQPVEDMAPYTFRRVFTDRYRESISLEDFQVPTPGMRSLLCFHPIYSLMVKLGKFKFLVLLRVLDLQKDPLIGWFPEVFESLVHLRYLAIQIPSDFPSSICKLINLQTLILEMLGDKVRLPRNISNLVNLRHLWSNNQLILPAIGKSMNLQSISLVRLGDEVDDIGRCFPNIKKLVYALASNEKHHFEHLPYLENLKLIMKDSGTWFDSGTRWLDSGTRLDCGRWLLFDEHHESQESLLNRIWFPASLKKLTLVACGLPWSDMSVIQELPNLEVLKLRDNAFQGSQWDACEQQFQQLKFLALEKLNIKRWEAYSASFPCLRQLALRGCSNLEGVPLEIGDILTLELIETDGWNSQGVTESVKRILREQRDEGNTLLKIIVGGIELSEHEDSEFE